MTSPSNVSRSHSESSLHRLRDVLFHRKSVDLSSSKPVLKKVLETPTRILKDAIQRTKSLRHQKHHSYPPPLPPRCGSLYTRPYALSTTTLLGETTTSTTALPKVNEVDDEFDTGIQDFIIPTTPVYADSSDSEAEEPHTPKQRRRKDYFCGFRDFETVYLDTEVDILPRTKYGLNLRFVEYGMDSTDDEHDDFYDAPKDTLVKRNSLESLESEISLSRFLE